MEYLIEKVFEEFQKNLKYLLEKHDQELERLQAKCSDMRKRMDDLEKGQVNMGWKIVLLASVVSSGLGFGAKEILGLLK